MKSESVVRALGLWNMGDGRFHTLLSPEDAKKTIRRAFDNGIDTFDTAVSYGNADTFLAAVAKERHLGRETYRVWSKVMPVPSLERRFEGELRNLKSEYVDVLMLHWPTEEKLLFSSLKTLEKLQENGKAREIGVGNFPTELLRKVSADFPVAYHERALSPIWTKGWEEEKSLGIKTIGYAPGAFGTLGARYNDTLPSDERRNLFVWQRREFFRLREKIQEIADKKGSTPYEAAVGYTLGLEPYAVAYGTGRKEDVVLTNAELTKEEMEEISHLSSLLMATTGADNVFGHNWHLA